MGRIFAERSRLIGVIFGLGAPFGISTIGGGFLDRARDTGRRGGSDANTGGQRALWPHQEQEGQQEKNTEGLPPAARWWDEASPPRRMMHDGAFLPKNESP